MDTALLWSAVVHACLEAQERKIWVKIPPHEPALMRREKEALNREVECGVPEYRRLARSESEPEVA